MARWIDMVIHSLIETLPSRPSCLLVASMPCSANETVGLLFFSTSAPWRTEGAFQNFLLAVPRLLAHLGLLVQLGDDDVPAADGHQHEDRERRLGDEVAALPQRFEAVRVVDRPPGCLAGGCAAGAAGAARCRRSGGRLGGGCGRRRRFAPGSRATSISRGDDHDSRGHRRQADILQHVVSRQIG
jgi:hypothetical protein